ncbi:MAG: hypothetical protein JWN06_2531 [Propionibacteriaceae bacterium]|jgi:predicted cobalt transporter CbtA|nr:hypothetical protein [Propionibacteriaceae bacterium]
MSAREFLTRGLLAGLLAGIVAFGVAYVAGEPPVNAAIALEETAGGAGHSHDAGTPGHTHDEAEVPRSLQSTLGLLTGTVVAGVTLGGLVGVLSALAMGRFGSVSPRATTTAVAAAGFIVLYVLPFLAYPPNPPAVGSSETIGVRTAAYFTLLAVSVLAAVVAVLVGRHLRTRLDGWHATLVGAATYLVLAGGAVALFPRFNEVPAHYPATVLYDFRLASFATQLALWAVLGLVLAELVHRLATRTATLDADRVAV